MVHFISRSPMRLPRVAEPAIILHFSQNSIEFGLEEHAHAHTRTCTSTLKHSLRAGRAGGGGGARERAGNVNKMDRVECVCCPSPCCDATLPHCITLAFLLHGISASAAHPLGRPPTFNYPHSQPPAGGAVVRRHQHNIIWHCILSSVFFGEIKLRAHNQRQKQERKQLSRQVATTLDYKYTL